MASCASRTVVGLVEPWLDYLVGSGTTASCWVSTRIWCGIEVHRHEEHASSYFDLGGQCFPALGELLAAFLWDTDDDHTAGACLWV